MQQALPARHYVVRELNSGCCEGDLYGVLHRTKKEPAAGVIRKQAFDDFTEERILRGALPDHE
jgi:hypothetical protein